MTQDHRYGPPPMLGKNWWGRNWKWFLPGVIVGGILFFCALVAAIVTLVMGLIKSSGAYEMALSTAKNSSAVRHELGEPIQESYWVMGSINTSGSSGSADLSIPVSGPHGKATLYIKAEKEAGQWHLFFLVLELSDSHRIDLLEEQKANTF